MTQIEMLPTGHNRRPRPMLTYFAQVDPGLFGVALFRPLPKLHRSAARRHTNEIETQFAGRKLKIVSAYTLAADDLSVLLAVCALCGLSGLRLEARHSNAHRIAIVDGLESEGEIVNEDHIRVSTTIYEVVREAGLTDAGNAYKRVTESLERMSAVQYTDQGPVEGGTRTLRLGGKQRLLSAIAEEATGVLKIVLNARFSAAIFDGQFAKIYLDEARSLTERSRILHTRLSVSIRENGLLRVSTDKLAEWLYCGPAGSSQQLADRRKYVRSALAGIAVLQSWTWEDECKRRHVVKIRRASR